MTKESDLQLAGALIMARKLVEALRQRAGEAVAEADIRGAHAELRSMSAKERLEALAEFRQDEAFLSAFESIWRPDQ